jgi:DNA-binding winged helix-turn-helix (wHTH) protein/TolB-like protein/tetratricopeptide (TPR) repeat protein
MMDRPNFDEGSPNIADVGPATAWRFGGFRYDARRGELTGRDGAPIALRPKIEQLLREFLARPGERLGREELMAALWPNVVVTDDSLAQCVRELRAALGDQAQRLISTLPRRGYRFEGVVTPITPAAVPKPGSPAGARALAPNNATAPAYEAATPKAWRPTRRLVAAATSVFIAIAGLVLWHAFIAPSSALPSRIDEATALRHITAVLPFAVADEDPRLRKIAGSVGDEIADQLARYPGMRAIGRRTTETLGAADRAPQALASTLHARYAVSGRVATVPGTKGAAIDVEVLAVPDGIVIASAHFDVGTSPEAATARDVGELVTNLVRGKAGEIETARATAPGHKPDATDLVVIGWEELNRLTSLEDTLRARARFQEALRQDPDSVLALTGLAAAYLQAKIRRMPLTPSEATEFEATVAHALKIAPNDPTTALVWAVREQLEGRPELAIPAIEKANRLMPSSPNGHFMLGLSLIRVGRLDDAQPELDRALRLALLGNDPRRASNAYTASAEIALMRGNDALAAELARQSIAMRPVDAGGANAYAVLAAAEALAGNQKEAEVDMAIFRRKMPNESVANYDAKSPSKHPAFIAQRARLYEGLHKAGLPE